MNRAHASLMPATELLCLQGVTRRFDAITVADEIDLRFTAGQPVGVIGPNGAGKTSLLNLIGGQLRPDRGRILFAGHDITHWSASRRCRVGIGRTYQIPQPFGGMTVHDNVRVGAVFGAGMSLAAAREWADECLQRCGLWAQRFDLAGSLRLLDRKRLELARALACRPKLLLLDEIGGGLTDAEVQVLITVIHELIASGVTIVWIEHIVHALVAVVERLVVLDFGRVIADGNPHRVLQEPAVRQIYLGVEANVENG